MTKYSYIACFRVLLLLPFLTVLPDRTAQAETPETTAGSRLKSFGSRFRSGENPSKLEQEYLETLCTNGAADLVEQELRARIVSSVKLAPLPTKWESRPDILRTTSTPLILEKIRNRLFKHWPCGGQPPRIHVSAGLQYNAIAGADGHIVFNIGLLKSAESEDELAFFVAHEMAHVLRGHFSDEETKSIIASSTRTAGELVRAQGTLKQLDTKKSFKGNGKGKGLSHNGPKFKDPKKVQHVNDKTYSVMNDIEDVVTMALAPHWNRRQEDEADLIAVDLMARAGYRISVLDNVFKNFDKSQGEDKDFLKQTRARFSEVQKEVIATTVAELKADPTQAASLFSDPLAFSKAKGGAAFKNFARKAALDYGKSLLSSKHRKPAKRLDRLMPYIGNFHRRALRPVNASSREAYRSHLSNSDYSQLIKFSELLHKADMELGGLDFEEASNLVQKASQGSNNNFSGLRRIKAEIRLHEGRPDLARQNAELALKSPYPGYRSYERLAEEYLAEGNLTEASRVTMSARKRYGDKTHYLPEQINIALHKGENDKATKLYDACVTSKIASLQKPCLAAIASKRHDFRTESEEILKSAGCNNRAWGANKGNTKIAQVMDGVIKSSDKNTETCFFFNRPAVNL